MPRIQLTKSEMAQHKCGLCGGPASFYLVRQVAPSMFGCYRCFKR